MAVRNLPKSKEIEQPLLDLLSDEKEHRWGDLVDKLADHFSLTNKELDERYPKSRQKIFYHRCRFAMLDLKKKKKVYVESSRPEYWKITKL